MVGNVSSSGTACDLTAEQTRVVTRVETADTLALDDGTEVLLIGALPPQTPNGPGSDPHWQPTELSRVALEKLVNGKAVDLAFGGRKRDRFGRQLAQVFVHAEPDRVWVQGNLIRHGWARAYGLPGSAACGADLLNSERLARLNQQGHWSSGIFQDRDARDPRELAQFRDTFQTIEGRIARATHLRGQIVYDFSLNGHTDFSVWLAPKRRGRRAANQVEELVGRRVRVRGWVEMRRGPRLNLEDDQFIEILEDDHEDTSSPSVTSHGAMAPIPATTRNPQ
jgi:micrococcal nuclease